MIAEAMENKALRQCSGCHSTITLEHFNMNRKGEYYKTCNRSCSRMKEWNDANKDAIAKHTRDYRERNKEALAQRDNERRQQNKEHIAEQSQAYREANRERLAKQRKEHSEANKDILREKRIEHNEKNPDKVYDWYQRELAKRKIICERGASYSKYNVADHCKFNRRHLEWLASRDNADANPTG